MGVVANVIVNGERRKLEVYEPKKEFLTEKRICNTKISTMKK